MLDDEIELEPEAESAPEIVLEPEAESMPEIELEPEAESAPEIVLEPEAESAPEIVLEPEAESAPEIVLEPETESAPEIVLEPETESAPEIVLEPETESAPEIVLEPEEESEGQPEFDVGTEMDFGDEFALDDEFELEPEAEIAIKEDEEPVDLPELDLSDLEYTDLDDEIPSEENLSVEKAQLLSPPKFQEALEDMSGGEMLGLFRFLKTITLALPEDKLSNYLFSDERIKMEYVIDRLSGKSGLKDDLRIGRIRRSLGKKQEPARNTDFGETLDFLEAMVTGLPDQGFAVTFKNKLERIRDRYNENT